MLHSIKNCKFADKVGKIIQKKIHILEHKSYKTEKKYNKI